MLSKNCFLLEIFFSCSFFYRFFKTTGNFFWSLENKDGRKFLKNVNYFFLVFHYSEKKDRLQTFGYQRIQHRFQTVHSVSINSGHARYGVLGFRFVSDNEFVSIINQRHWEMQKGLGKKLAQFWGRGFLIFIPKNAENLVARKFFMELFFFGKFFYSSCQKFSEFWRQRKKVWNFYFEKFLIHNAPATKFCIQEFLICLLSN